MKKTDNYELFVHSLELHYGNYEPSERIKVKKYVFKTFVDTREALQRLMDVIRSTIPAKDCPPDAQAISDAVADQFSHSERSE